MAIKLYKTRDEVPAERRDSAIETKSGEFAIEEEADGAKKALDAERDARAKADAKAKAASDALKAAEKERDELKLKADAAASGVTEAKLQEIRDAEAKARKPIEDKLAAIEAENRKLKLDDKFMKMFLDPEVGGGMPQRRLLAERSLLPFADLGDAGGLVFKDDKGQVTAEDAKTFFTRMKGDPNYASLFAGSGASGSGGEGSNGGGGSGYDPVAAGKAAADQQKKGAGDTKLAFT